MKASTFAQPAEAARCLDWPGQVVGPVEFAGVRFHAVRAADTDGDPWAPLAGALFTGPAGRGLLRAASRLAAYAPRAVLIDHRPSIGFLVEAALLDIGVVAPGPDGPTMLAVPGPRVPSRMTTHELDLLKLVDAARPLTLQEL